MVNLTLSRDVLTARWPHIARYLYIDHDEEGINGDYNRWYFANTTFVYPDVELAAACDEWADFYSWRWEQRRPVFANDRNGRCYVERWTDDMVYACKRSAAHARGENPGEWIPQYERRPDLGGELRAIVNEICAKLNAGGGRSRIRETY